MVTKITIVRHGETEWNKTIQLQGHQNSNLTSRGVKQAELLAETIRFRQFDMLITSDLERAIHTSRIINKHLQLTMVEHSDLRERAFGVMEGLKLKKIKSEYPEVYDAYISRDINYSIPKGESLKVFNSRVISCINEIAITYSGKNILLVAHGGVLDCIARNIFNMELDEFRCFSVFNTSVNTIQISSQGWVLEEWGNIEHLKEIETLNEL